VKPANEPGRDYARLVADGYDACAAAFNATRRLGPDRVAAPLAARLQAGSRVLDLGCGAGVPIARTLAKTFRVTGVDLSRAQLELARDQVPEAEFIWADMRTCAFASATFDAVVSFYAIFHLPREEHAALFRRISDWLKPGGYFMATLSSFDESSYTEDGFFGVEMFWSNFGMERYRVMLADAGLAIAEESMAGHGYGDAEGQKPEAHPLVFAQKTDRPS
jgi:cyclopropane fatty-acyl-phospholipid synthase-like methyltransferase